MSFPLPRARLSGPGESTSTSSLAGSWHVALRCGDGAGATGGSAGAAGGAALTGVGAMTRSNSSVVGRRRAVAKTAGAKEAEDETNVRGGAV